MNNLWRLRDLFEETCARLEFETHHEEEAPVDSSDADDPIVVTFHRVAIDGQAAALELT